MNLRNLPWHKLLIVSLCSIVVGNTAFTFVLYAMGIPQYTAWTGHVMESTPGAANDLLLAVVLLLIAVHIMKHE